MTCPIAQELEYAFMSSLVVVICQHCQRSNKLVPRALMSTESTDWPAWPE